MNELYSRNQFDICQQRLLTETDENQESSVSLRTDVITESSSGGQGFIMPPPSVTRKAYCFPRRQLIFRFGRRVIYHSKGLWEYIPKLIPSVCTTIFKRIAGLSFYSKSLMLYINGFVNEL